jgi:hypothetical protein
MARDTSRFVLWRDEKPYDNYWIVSDTRTGERLLQTRDERFARNVLHMMRTQSGWWD